MQLLKLVVLLTSSLLFIACNGPETSSSNGDFFNLGLPSTHNKLSDEDEKKAHDIVAMVEDSLASVNEQKYAEGLELKQYFKVGEYQPSDFRSEVRATCQLERKQESSRTAGKAIEYRWSENSQKSTRHLEVSKGEELIPCPINLAVTESSLGGAMTKGLEQLTYSSWALNLSIDELKELDREKSTRDKYAYKKSSLSPITSVAVSVSSEGLEKPLRGYRSPGKTVASETRTYDVKYKEGGESKSAKLKVVYRVMATDSKKSESTNLRYGRKVTGLIVEMASGTATVEESVVFNGEMDNDTYTKVNGKMLFQNGKLVEEERN